MGSGSSYTVEEVRALVESYQRLREAVSTSPKRLWLLVRLLDLGRAFREAPLSPEQQLAVWLCGIVGLTRQDAANVLGVDEKTMDRRWANGTLVIANWLNA